MKPGMGVSKLFERKPEPKAEAVPKIDIPAKVKVEPPKRELAKIEPQKREIAKIEPPKREESPPSTRKLGSKKYDDFMKFMENIEEEMTSEYERSS
jgi:hypothetical protein